MAARLLVGGGGGHGFRILLLEARVAGFQDKVWVEDSSGPLRQCRALG